MKRHEGPVEGDRAMEEAQSLMCMVKMVRKTRLEHTGLELKPLGEYRKKGKMFEKEALNREQENDQLRNSELRDETKSDVL